MINYLIGVSTGVILMVAGMWYDRLRRRAFVKSRGPTFQRLYPYLYPLWKHMAEDHDLVLTEQELADIVYIVRG